MCNSLNYIENMNFREVLEVYTGTATCRLHSGHEENMFQFSGFCFLAAGLVLLYSVVPGRVKDLSSRS